MTFLAIAPVFVGATKVDRALRWILTGSFAVTIGALGVVSAFFGFGCQDTFEIAAISIVWLTLVVAGPLMAIAFGRAARGELPAARAAFSVPGIAEDTSHA